MTAFHAEQLGTEWVGYIEMGATDRTDIRAQSFSGVVEELMRAWLHMTGEDAGEDAKAELHAPQTQSARLRDPVAAPAGQVQEADQKLAPDVRSTVREPRGEPFGGGSPVVGGRHPVTEAHRAEPVKPTVREAGSPPAVPRRR